MEDNAVIRLQLLQAPYNGLLRSLEMLCDIDDCWRITNVNNVLQDKMMQR